MPKTRSGLDTTDGSFSVKTKQKTSKTKRHTRKRKFPSVQQDKNSRSKQTKLKQPTYYLDQLSTSTTKLDYYHHKSSKTTRFYESKDEPKSEKTLNASYQKLSAKNKAYIKEIGVPGLPEEVILFVEGYWQPLINFRPLEPFSEKDETDEIDRNKRYFTIEDGQNVIDILANPVVDTKFLDDKATEICHELKNVLLTTIQSDSRFEDSVVANDELISVDDLCDKFDTFFNEDCKSMVLPKIGDFKTKDTKKLDEKIKHFSVKAADVRKQFVKIMHVFDKAHHNLLPEYKNLTKYIRILKISIGEVARESKDVRVTRMAQKLVPYVGKDMDEKEVRNWIHIFSAVGEKFKEIYKKMSQIHEFNLQFYSELLTLQLSYKIQHSKLIIQTMFEKFIPVISFKKAGMTGKSHSLDDATCTICIAEFEDTWTRNLRKLPCDHIFHSECIDTWLRTGKRTCPFCRKEVFGKHEAYHLLDLSEQEVINTGFDEIEGEIQDVTEILDDENMSYTFDDSRYLEEDGSEMSNWPGLRRMGAADSRGRVVDDFPNIDMTDAFESETNRQSDVNRRSINRAMRDLAAISNPNRQTRGVANPFANDDLWEEVMQPLNQLMDGTLDVDDAFDAMVDLTYSETHQFD